MDGKGSATSEGPAGLKAYYPTAHYWVDGGKRIVFEAADSNGYGCNHRPLACLWVMDADGLHKRKLAPDSELASVSGSGRLLARLVNLGRRRHHLIITTLAGKKVRMFAFRPSSADEDDFRRPTWAPDESAVAFEGSATLNRVYVAERRKGVRVIARGRFLYSPAWSPDSRLIAFRRCPDEPPIAGCDLMVTRRDGSHTRVVARDIDTEDPSWFGPPLPDPWSPNGHWLVFARNVQIYVIRPDGSGLRRVTDVPLVIRRLAWSPDSKRLAYIAGGVFVIGVHGGRARQVTTKKNQGSLSWAPSERILYSRRGVIWTVTPGHPPVAIR
jgi:hypothetical protein